MKKAPIPENDDDRLKELFKYEVLDTQSEPAFDDITKLAAKLCETEICLISLVDRDRQWFKSRFGLDACETSREISFCGHAIMSDDLFIVENTLEDERFADNPLVTDDPNIRFYAGAPLRTPSGFRIGTLCIIDSKPKRLSEFQKSSLRALGNNVISLLELQFKNEELIKTVQQSYEIQKMSQTGGWELDIETGKVIWTEEVYKIHALDNDLEVSKIDGLSYYPEPDRSRLEKHLERTAAEKSSYDGVFAFIDAKGTHKWVRAQGKAVLDENLNVFKLSGTFQDVTKQRRAELIDQEVSKLRKAFIENKGDISTFFEIVLDNLLRVTRSEYGFIGEVLEDENGQYLKTYSITDISWNKEMKDYFDSSIADGLEFKNLDNLFGEVIKSAKSIITNDPSSHAKSTGTPKGHPPLNCFMGIPLFRDKKLNAMIGIANRENGYNEDYYEEIKPFLDAIGEAINYFKIEQEKRDIELQRKVILESTGLAIWRYFPKTSELHWDESMYKLYGIDQEDFSGHYSAWEQSLHPEDMERATNILRDALDGVGNFDTSFRIITKDKEIKYIRAKAEVIRDSRGQVEKMMGVNWDYSQEVQSKNKLIEAKEKAVQFAKAKSDFLANMSHEIRTPMNGVLGMVSLLFQTDLTKEQRDMLGTVQSCGDGLLTILNDILDFSKIESGMLELENKSLSVKKIVEEGSFLVANMASEKGITVETRLEEETPKFIKGDVNRIKQVVVNLLSNAVKFTEKGKVVFEVYPEKNNDQENIVFSIKDTGIGISQENQKKLFTAFSQADSSITRRFGGTGLGLSISSKLVEMMNGEITFESEINKGSTFKASIPLIEGEEVQDLSEKKTKALYSKEFAGENPHKILIVEDNKVNQKLAMLMFQKLGYIVTVAEDGQKALDIIAEHYDDEAFSLIFMDMQMPVMDGVTATKEIISTYANQSPPIIAMTANVLKEDKERCFDAGMIDFIPKPILLKDIKRILKEY